MLTKVYDFNAPYGSWSIPSPHTFQLGIFKFFPRIIIRIIFKNIPMFYSRFIIFSILMSRHLQVLTYLGVMESIPVLLNWASSLKERWTSLAGDVLNYLGVWDLSGSYKMGAFSLKSLWNSLPEELLYGEKERWAARKKTNQKRTGITDKGISEGNYEVLGWLAL